MGIPTDLQAEIDKINDIGKCNDLPSKDEIDNPEDETAAEFVARICKDVNEKQKNECDILRRRVAELLRSRGCPSRVRPLGSSSRSGYTGFIITSGNDGLLGTGDDVLIPFVADVGGDGVRGTADDNLVVDTAGVTLLYDVDNATDEEFIGVNNTTTDDVEEFINEKIGEMQADLENAQDELMLLSNKRGAPLQQDDFDGYGVARLGEKGDTPYAPYPPSVSTTAYEPFSFLTGGESVDAVDSVSIKRGNLRRVIASGKDRVFKQTINKTEKKIDKEKRARDLQRVARKKNLDLRRGIRVEDVKMAPAENPPAENPPAEYGPAENPKWYEGL